MEMAHRVYGDREMELLSEVITSGRLGALDGPFTSRFEEEFARMMGAKYAVAMNCAMSVLHTSVICADAGAGTEVICDPVFVFGALSALYNNAVPRFVDIDPDSLTLDPGKLEAAINERTRAIIVTHAWGLPADMDPVMEIAHRHNLIVIEDIAHAILATYKGRYTGTLGDIGSFSFQASKHMSLGDGGMATTSDDKLAKTLDLNAGAPTFFAVAHGLHYNYRMNELTAAVGVAQLERLPELIRGLQRNAKYYDDAVAGCKWLPLQSAPDAQSTYHFWVANFRGEEHGLSLDEFRKALQDSKCGVSIGYTGMTAYQHPVIKDRMAHAFHCGAVREKVEYPEGLCPIAERAIRRMVLAYTLQPEDAAKASAEKLHDLINRL
jgi:dTDP-4-amino-4,6-dideoxygalactose transaminase